MIAYAGSFVLMEEYSEKTEKTEKSEEALYSLYHSKHHAKSLSKSLTGSEGHTSRVDNVVSKSSTYYLPSDFNVHFIYHASYLDSVVSPS